MIKKYLGLSLSLMLMLSFHSYAMQDLSYEDTNTYVKNLALESLGPHLVENENGVFYNVDRNGNILFGKSYTSNGQILYTMNEETGPSKGKVGIKKDGVDENGLYYNSDGFLENPMAKNPERYEPLCKELEENGEIHVNSLKDMVSFFDYYDFQYSLNNIHNDYFEFTGDNNGGYVVTLKDWYKYDREYVKNLIREKFGSLEGETIEERLLSASLKLKDMVYDMDYESKNLVDSVNDMHGVCWQYAKIAQVLLEDAGYDVELWFGYYADSKDTGHCWLSVNDNNKIYYSDPTQACEYWMANYDISYEDYIRLYKPNKTYSIIVDN